MVRLYVAVTGSVFTLMIGVHIWRVIAEGPSVAANPPFVVGTLVALGLSVWASWLLWRMRRRPVTDATPHT